jgi:hypothetical protein
MEAQFLSPRPNSRSFPIAKTTGKAAPSPSSIASGVSSYSIRSKPWTSVRANSAVARAWRPSGPEWLLSPHRNPGETHREVLPAARGQPVELRDRRHGPSPRWNGRCLSWLMMVMAATHASP